MAQPHADAVEALRCRLGVRVSTLPAGLLVNDDVARAAPAASRVVVSLTRECGSAGRDTAPIFICERLERQQGTQNAARLLRVA